MQYEYFFYSQERKRTERKFAPLKKAGYKVVYHFSQETTTKLKDNLPDALVICLDRLPSHGRAYAEWMWEAMKRQHIPIVFCGSQPNKIETARIKFTRAIFCSNEQLIETLKKI